jgi:uncharacterized protein (TIGR02996 family)
MDTYTFEELIKTYPDDKVLRFAYADHLEEEGNTRLANNIRVILELGLKPADCTFHKNFPAWCWFNKETSRCGWEIELNDILKVNSDNSRITRKLFESIKDKLSYIETVMRPLQHAISFKTRRMAEKILEEFYEQ